MKKYLVTGGFGFLGRSLVKALVLRGYAVRVLDNASRGTPESLKNLDLPKERLEVFHGDIRDAKAVREAVQGVDAVCHLAYINGTEYFYTRPAEILDVGVKGMVHVLDACIEQGVGELLLMSSSEVYQTPPSVPTKEDVPLLVPNPLNPRYSYGGGKIISELMAINYGRQYFKKVLIVRPHNVFGPNMGREHVIPQFVGRMLSPERQMNSEGEIVFPIQGTGQQTRSFIFVDDFTEGLCLVLEKGEHLNIYHVGTMEEWSIADVAQKVAQCLECRIRIVPGPEAVGGTPRRCPDIAKLLSLGFRARVSFEEGLRATAEWYASSLPKK